MLCNCIGQTHEDIEKMMEEGNYESVEEFQRDTFVGTGCGRCLPVVDDIFKKNQKV